MPDIVKLFKKTEEKKRFKKSNYRPWNFMDQMESEEKKAPSFPIAVSTKNDETKKKITKEKILPRSTFNSFYASKKHSLNNNIGSSGIKKTLILNTDEESSVDKIFRLCGYQKLLFLFIVDRCFSRGMLTTGAVSNNSLAKLLDTSSRMVKTTVQRLVGKNLVIREKGKKGRGGFYVFSIDESIRAASLEYKRLLVADDLSEVKKTSNSHHIDINSAQLSKNNIALELEEWKNVDIEPLREIGFSEYHLKQLALLPTLSSEIVQNSIHAFAFDLEKNDKRKTITGAPLNFFMGIFRTKGGYTPPSNYETPKGRFMRAWQEKMSKRNTEPERAKIEKEVFNSSFNDWFKNFTDEQKIEFLPKNLRVENQVLDNHKAKERAIHRFEKEIWPDIKNKIASGNEDL